METDLPPIDTTIGRYVKNAVPPPTELEVLAEDIAEAHKRVVDATSKGLRFALECGELLMDAKTKVPHGQWDTWLNENLPDEMGVTIARIYMRLWAHRDKLQSHDPHSIREAMQLIAGERNQSINFQKRNQAIAMRSAHPDMTVREISDRVNASPTSVQIWLNPVSRKKRDARYLKKRARKIIRCPHCGGQLHKDGTLVQESLRA